jgi:hypothetical protein
VLLSWPVYLLLGGDLWTDSSISDAYAQVFLPYTQHHTAHTVGVLALALLILQPV